MPNSKLVKELVDEFVDRGYTWRIGGILRPPSVEDMKQALDRADAMLKDGEQMEMGRLVITKIGDHMDVYLLIGDYHDVDIH